MEFLYPLFINPTHVISVEECSNSEELPTGLSFDSRRDFRIPKDVSVCVVEELAGFQQLWTRVKIVDSNFQDAEYYNKTVYIPKLQLKNISSKQEYLPISNVYNLPNPNAAEVDPNLKELFVPYVDEKNGLYSVRIQTDYERLVDQVLFYNALEESLVEGASILLASRGFKSDNATINELREKYLTFAYINKDLDITVYRSCEPITFTVSIPMRFFNAFEPEPDIEEQQAEIDKIITLSNVSFVRTIDQLLSSLTGYTGDLEQFLAPNKYFDGFDLNIEIFTINEFSSAFAELVGSADFQLRSEEEIEYQIQLSNNYDFLGVLFKRGNRLFKASRSLVSQMRLRGAFNNKRIFFYLDNLQNMRQDAISLDVFPFITKYVKYPTPQLKNYTVKINDRIIPQDTVEEYYAAYASNSDNCLTFANLKAVSQGTLAFTDNIYSLFIDNQLGNQTINSTWSDLKKNLSTIKNSNQQIRDTPVNSQSLFNLADFRETAIDKVSQLAQEEGEYSPRRLANSLLYVCHRINLNKIIFNAIFCKTRNANLAEIVSQVPDQILFYLENSRELSQLRGREFVKAVVNGFNINGNIYCSSDDAQLLSYFIKGLSILMKGFSAFNALGGIIQRTSAQLERITNKDIPNPYRAISKTISEVALKLLVDTTLDYLGEILSDSCEDDNFASDGNNYQSPFNSHLSRDRFQSAEAYDPNTINNNRNNVLSEVFANELQFGYDREEVVDLIKELLDYVNCVLTAQESVQLLQGEPTEIVVALVKNIIKNRFKQLSFIADNDEKMLLFFKRLGLTVDQDIVQSISENITYLPVESSLCKATPDQEEIRKKILNDKVPPDLGILGDARERRAKSARKLLDLVQNGNSFEFDISPLCPDNPSKEASEFKDYIGEQYVKNLDSLFSSPISSFTQQASTLSEEFEEKNNFYRKKADETLKESVEFYTLQKDYGHNLLQNNLNTSEELTEIKIEDGKLVRPVNDKQIYKYQLNYNRFISNDSSQALSTILNSAPVSLGDLKVCKQNLQLSDFIKQFIGDQQRVYNETFFMMSDRAFIVESALLDELLNEEELNDVDPLKLKYYNAINDKKFIATLTFNYDIPAGTALSIPIIGPAKSIALLLSQGLITINTVTFRLFYKNSNFTNSKFEEAFVYEVTNEDLKNELYRDNFYGEFEDDFKLIDDNYSNSVYKVSYETVQKSSDRVKSVFDDVFKKFESKIKQIEQFEDTQKIATLYGNPIFRIETVIDDKTKKLTRLVLTPSVNFSQSPSNPTVSYREFFKIEEQSYVNAEQTLFSEQDQTITQERLERLLHVSTALNPYVNIMPEYGKFVSAGSYDAPWWEEVYDFFGGDAPIPEDPLTNVDVENVAFLKTSEYFKNYLELNKFNIPRTQQHVNCDLYPHYLNYQYFRKKALNSLKEELCDDNFDREYRRMVRDISVNMLYRTMVTTNLLKCLPYLSLLNREEFINLYKDKFVIKAISNFIRKQLEIFSPEQSEKDADLANDILLANTRKLYEEYARSRRIIKKYTVDYQEEPLEMVSSYFIRKEVDYFVRFCIKNNIIKLRDYNLADFVEKARQRYPATGISDERKKVLSNDVLQKPSMNTVYSFIGTLFQKINDIQLSQQELAILTDDARNFIFNERYSLLLYSIMSCEVDPKKRFIFSQTISELFLIMSNNSKQTDIDIPDQKIALTNKETNIEDIEKFLANAGYSNIPMALIALNPRYSKYLKFFAKALFDSTREIVLRTAQYSDPNIVLTRAINDGLAIGSVTAWSFVNPDSRNELLYANLGAYWLFSRLNEGRSPLPDFATSTGIAVKGVPPSKIGVGYIALDTVNEVLYLAEKNKEWREHLKNSGQENKDPCETGTKFNAPTECNLETKQTLQRNMDEQEGT